MALNEASEFAQFDEYDEKDFDELQDDFFDDDDSDEIKTNEEGGAWRFELADNLEDEEDQEWEDDDLRKDLDDF